MRKILFLSAFAISLLANAQTTEDSQESTSSVSERKNDIMLSPIELVTAPVLNVSYERLLSENAGVGLNVMVLLESEDDDGDFAQFSPYYRQYFGKKYASGFFVEGFVPVTSTTDVYYYSNSGPYDSRSEKKRTTVGVGVGFGGKWVARKNIIFEASIGIARRFGDSGYYESDSNITGKGMLGIGYRF